MGPVGQSRARRPQRCDLGSTSVGQVHWSDVVHDRRSRILWWERNTVAEVWNGSTWSVLPTPNVGRRLIIRLGELDGVSCAGQAFCQAVGHSVDASANLHNLIEGWNGSSWSIVVAPDSGSASINSLGGVSCISATVCTAVGSAGPSANRFLRSFSIGMAQHGPSTHLRLRIRLPRQVRR